MNKCGGGYYKTLKSVNNRLAPGESIVKRYDNLDAPLLQEMKDLVGGSSCKSMRTGKKSMKAGAYHMKAGVYHKKSGKMHKKSGKMHKKSGKMHKKSGKMHMKSGKKHMKVGKKSMKGGKFGCRQPVWDKDCQ